jgi:putative ATP-dependent endonuclease of OLD family
MTFIADTKIEADKNVIFAMEEPEIAIPPYTQRRITETLFKISNQIFITSHSPYISEKFLLEDILVLENRDGILISNRVNNDLIKEKILRRDFRNRFAEGIMSRGILAVEGISDDLVLHYISEKLDKWKDDYISLDILGITIVNNEGSGNINKLGQFFKSLNIKTYAFYDEGTDIDDKFFNIAKNNRYKGLEELIVEETPIIKLMEFLLACEKFPDCPKFEIGNDSKKKVCEILKKRKAEGYSVKLLEFCTCEEHFPNTIVKFLRDINDDFSK